MVFQLAILIVIPIIFGIVVVSPFEIEPEPVPEPVEEVPQEEPNFTALYILLGIIWLFFLIRVLRQIVKGTYRIRTRI
ncbi:MAG: hypothetical protein ACE5EJ_02735 [Nitrosopumilaceae archaeon]